jgi:hypothetical protein
MNREELTHLLVSNIAAELDAGRWARPSPDREAHFHRADAYCDLLAQLDEELVNVWRTRIEAARRSGPASEGGEQPSAQ